MSLADQPLRQLLASFSSSDPTPGGGSASALSAALGASLLMMVAGLPKTRTGAASERSALDGAAGALGDIRARLTDAIDADAAAYDRVVAAYKLPKLSADEQAARKAAIQSDWGRPEFYATTEKAKVAELEREEQALGVEITSLMAKWEALEAEIATLASE